MKIEADHKWKSRLLRKNSIEDALADHNAALDDATRSFQVGLTCITAWPQVYLDTIDMIFRQIATLINIHLAVGDRCSGAKSISSSAVDESQDTSTSKSSVFPDDTEVTDVTLTSLQYLDKMSDLINLSSPLLETSVSAYISSSVIQFLIFWFKVPCWRKRRVCSRGPITFNRIWRLMDNCPRRFGKPCISGC